MRNLILTISSLFVLTACTTAPTLQDRLVGKSADEKTAMVKQECFDEANSIRKGKNFIRDSSHAKKIKEICEVITAVQ